MPPVDWYQLLGRTCTFDSEPEDWERCSVPSGSEGSIQYKIVEEPLLAAMAAYTVPIWGDLRDFGEDDTQKILEWFNDVCDKCDPSSGAFVPNTTPIIRDAVITIDVEGGSYIVLTYVDGKIGVVTLREESGELVDDTMEA